MTRILYILLLLSIWLPPPAHALKVNRQIPVMLSFDTEMPEDREALNRLKLTVPATYFFTGKFAEENRDFVARIARGNNTVGSHSFAHLHLTKLDSLELAEDLKKSKEVLESITGKPVTWFRAPYLEYNEQVMKVLKALGFIYDSSDQDRWQRQDVLFELPISTLHNGEMIASDYDLMYTYRLNEKQFERWLKTLYNEKAAIGEPLMILLHPKMVGRYPVALQAFIDYVEQEGGVFLSADDYVERLNSHTAKRYAVWVDFSLGGHSPEQVVLDIAGIKATDVFLMAKDTAGRTYFGRQNGDRDLFGETARLLKKSGIRVHAWLPALQDSVAAGRHPKWSMVAQNGAVSGAWLSPTHPKVLEHQAQVIRKLFKSYELDGLFLDKLRYPSLEFDYAQTALQAYALKTGRDSVPAIKELLSAQYLEWTNWRAARIAAFAEKIKQVVRREAGTRIELSASLDGSAAVSYTMAELYAQNYGLIARHLDLLVPVVDFHKKGRTGEWISQVIFSAKHRAGDKPLLVGIPAYRGAGEYGLEELSRALEFAGHGADGISVYPYLYLFGRGERDKNMPDGSVEVMKKVIEANRPDEHMLLGGLTETGIPVVPAVFMAMVLFILNFVAIPVFGRKFHTLETMDVSEEELPDKDWRQIDEEITTGSIDGMTAEKVAAILRRYDARKIQQNRIALVLDVINTADDPLQKLYSLRHNSQGWKSFALKYFHEVCLLGYAEVGEHSVELTGSCRMVLEKIKDKGFDSEFWIFVEKRLHETVVAKCPHCANRQITHFFWNSFECSECGKTVRLRDCDTVEVQPVDDGVQIPVNTVEFV